MARQQSQSGGIGAGGGGSLALHLRSLRCGAALTQRELARRLERSHTWVQKRENGGRSLELIDYIDWCRACHSTPQESFSQLLDH